MAPKTTKPPVKAVAALLPEDDLALVRLPQVLAVYPVSRSAGGPASNAGLSASGALGATHERVELAGSVSSWRRPTRPKPHGIARAERPADRRGGSLSRTVPVTAATREVRGLRGPQGSSPAVSRGANDEKKPTTIGQPSRALAYLHSMRFRRVSNRYPLQVTYAYGRDIARAAADSDEQVAATVAAWERREGLPVRDWPAIGRRARGRAASPADWARSLTRAEQESIRPLGRGADSPLTSLHGGPR